MENQDQQNPEIIQRKIHERVKEHMLGGVKGEIEERGIHALHDRLDKYFDSLNIAPSYLQEAYNSDFSEMRSRLNKESGIIISNHPGYVDIPAIIKCINREDVRIMVGERYFDQLRDLLGDKYIVPATREGNAQLSIMRTIEDHIKSGGVFLIFPSGGGDRYRIDFKGGFSLFLKDLPPDAMVYSFYVNEDDISDIIGNTPVRYAGLASSALLHPSLNVNKLQEKRYFKVDEKYSTASEWQKVATDGKEREERQLLLTDHYKEIFHLDRNK